MTTPQKETSGILNVDYHWHDWTESSPVNDMEDTEESANPSDLNSRPLHNPRAQQRSDQDAVEVLSPANALRRPEQASPVLKADQSILTPKINTHGLTSIFYLDTNTEIWNKLPHCSGKITSLSPLRSPRTVSQTQTYANTGL